MASQLPATQLPPANEYTSNTTRTTTQTTG